MKKLILSIRKILFRQAYHLGFVEGSLSEIVYGSKKYEEIKWVDIQKHNNSWFADPFILGTNDECIEVLAEELEYSNRKGRISHLSINKKNLTLEKCKPSLDIATHLSFPAYLVENELVYVYPENYNGGAIRIYRYDKPTKKLCDPQVLLREDLVDAQILKFKDAYYIFGVKHEDDVEYSYEYTKNLWIYKSESLFGEYKFYQKIENNKKLERGAGHFFILNDKLIRPAQICEGGYGRGIVFFEVCMDENGLFVEKEVGHMYPGANKYPLQLHTFNAKDGYIIIDGMGYENKYLRPILTKLQLWLRK